MMKTKEKKTHGYKKRKDRDIELRAFIKKWNAVEIKRAEWFPKVKKVTKVLLDAWIKIRKEYEFDEMRSWSSRYVNEIKKRKLDSDYATHRFTLLEFIDTKRKKWIDKFINF